MPPPDVNNQNRSDGLPRAHHLAPPQNETPLRMPPLHRVIIARPLFFPVIVVDLNDWDRVAALGVKLREGSLTQEEVDQLARASASATFPGDDRGLALCKKLIMSTNAFNSARGEDGQPQIDPSGAQALQLTQEERREYSSLFVQYQCPPSNDERNLPALWCDFIGGRLAGADRVRLGYLLEESGQELFRFANDIIVVTKKRGE